MDRRIASTTACVQPSDARSMLQYVDYFEFMNESDHRLSPGANSPTPSLDPRDRTESPKLTFSKPSNSP
eukprot:3950384-Amphidinium_carterae.1